MPEAQRSDTAPNDRINAWFFKNVSLDELVRDARPLQTMDDLAIDDLTAEEAIAFLRAVEE